jgi:uncharacterized protein YodC (DUF2158 family)
MTAFKSGDLVVLKSGGPTMTVDAVNTSIFDDDKVTGIVCVWFIGDRLERVRFEHDAIEPFAMESVAIVPVASKPVRTKKTSSRKKAVRAEEASGEYKVVLDEMVTAMNTPADSEMELSKPVAKRPKAAPAPTHHVAVPTSRERH